jgi:predicted alpha/beta-hydrolase family hydrolase
VTLYDILPPVLRPPLVEGATWLWVEGIRPEFPNLVVRLNPGPDLYFVSNGEPEQQLRLVFPLPGGVTVQVGQSRPWNFAWPVQWLGNPPPGLAQLLFQNPAGGNPPFGVSQALWDHLRSLYEPRFGSALPVMEANPADVRDRPPRVWPRTHPAGAHGVVMTAVPGYEVELLYDGAVVNDGVVDPDGVALVELLGRGPFQAGHAFTARYKTSGPPFAPAGPASTVALDPVPHAAMVPCFEGWATVPVAGLWPGGMVELFRTTSTGAALPSTFGVVAVDGVARVRLATPLSAGESLSAQPIWPPASPGPAAVVVIVQSSDPCESLERGFNSLGDLLVPGDNFLPISPARPPGLRGVLREGQRRVRVSYGQTGAVWAVEMFAGPAPNAPIELYIGAAPALISASGRSTPSGWVDLPEPLGPDCNARVIALLPSGQWLLRGNQRAVHPAISPPVPAIVGPVADCAICLLVADVLPGSEVAVFADGTWIGGAFVEEGPTVTVQVPALVAGMELTAAAFLQDTRKDSDQIPRVTVSGPGIDPTRVLPRAVGPVLLGDNRVWASGVPPGARVQVLDALTGMVLGETGLPDGIGRVSCALAVTGPVAVRVIGCDEQDAASPALTPLAALRDEGTAVVESFFNYLLPWNDPSGISLELWGQVWRPATPGPAPPLAVIMPGVASFDASLDAGCAGLFSDDGGEQQMGYLGYRRVAEALASRGFVVVALKKPNLESPEVANFLAFALDQFSLDAGALGLAPGALAGARTLLVGHSTGGQAASAVINGLQTGYALLSWTPTQVRGFVGLAPFPATDFTQGVAIPSLYFAGSSDYFGDSFEVYPKYYLTSSAPRTFVWVRGATHGSWSSIWSGRDLRGDPADDATDGGERPFHDMGGLRDFDSAVPWQPDVAQAMADLVVAFALDRVLGLDEYRALLEGPVRPESVERLGWQVDHLISPTGLAQQIVLVPPVTELNWPTPDVEWRVALPGVPLQATDDVVLTFEVTEVDGRIGAADWIFDTFVHPAVTHTALDVVVRLEDGPISGGVRVGAVLRLPGKTQTWGGSAGYAMTARIPYDAFLAANPSLGSRPGALKLDLPLLTPDAAAVVSTVEIQRR